MAKCSKHWATAWIMRAFVARDEAIAPHKGKGPMRMYIPHKPSVTGVKLYVLADSTAPYVLDMYIYKGKCRLRYPPVQVRSSFHGQQNYRLLG